MDVKKAGKDGGKPSERSGGSSARCSKGTEKGACLLQPVWKPPTFIEHWVEDTKESRFGSVE